MAAIGRRFIKKITLGTTSIYEVTVNPNGALSATAGDLALLGSGAKSQTFVCSGGSVWTVSNGLTNRFTMGALSSLSNSAAETALETNGPGIIPANSAEGPTRIRIGFFGRIGPGPLVGAPTLTVRLRIGPASTPLASRAAFLVLGPTTVSANQIFAGTYEITTFGSTGAGQTWAHTGYITAGVGAGAGFADVNAAGSAPLQTGYQSNNTDSSVNELVDLTGQWSVADVANLCSCEFFSLDTISAPA